MTAVTWNFGADIHMKYCNTEMYDICVESRHTVCRAAQENGARATE